jgi:hypothetical protein
MSDLARHFEEQRRQKGLPYTSIETGEYVSGAAVIREEPPDTSMP